MGYRSNIKILAGEAAAKALTKLNKKHDVFTLTEGEGGEFLFEADYIKWYEEYPEVAAFMKVVNKFLAKTTGHENGIHFLRDGEEDDDVENMSNGLLNGYLTTSVVAEDFTPKKPADTTPPAGKKFVKIRRDYQATVTREYIYEVPKRVKNVEAYIKRTGLAPSESTFVQDLANDMDVYKRKKD
jgi:hypothetical protein